MRVQHWVTALPERWRVNTHQERLEREARLELPDVRLELRASQGAGD
jgi:hypothetical protein